MRSMETQQHKISLKNDKQHFFNNDNLRHALSESPDWQSQIVMCKWKVIMFVYQKCRFFSQTLKGQCHEIFCFRFFSWISFPQPQSIPLRPFRNFVEIRGDIHKSTCTTCINDTGGKFATGVNNTGGKIDAGINDTRRQIFPLFPQALLIPAANLPPVSTTPVANLELRIARRIFKTALKWYNQGLGRNWFMNKTRSKKSRDTVPFKIDLTA